MRRLWIPVFALLSLALASPAAAQGEVQRDVGGVQLKAEIPFQFVVKGETFPAGTYLVESATETADSPVLTIQRVGESSQGELRFVSVVTSPAAPADSGEPKLAFEQVGGLYFLDSVIPAHGMARDVRR